jgi:4'-phosphopantetheinyl transferase
VNSVEIHLWCAFYDEINDESLLAAYLELMSDAERLIEPRFYFPKDRRRYLVTRALARTVLSRYAEVAPRDWVFKANAHGRPEISNDCAAARNLSFNISHTDGLIVLAVTRDRQLGVDVENVLSRQAAIAIADRYFAPSEVAALGALPADQQQQRFYEYWTLKESYIKARGEGLAIALDAFSFRFPTNELLEMNMHIIEGDSSQCWLFWQFWIGVNHLTAVCAQRLPGARPSLKITKTVPLAWNEPLQYRSWRDSGR